MIYGAVDKIKQSSFNIQSAVTNWFQKVLKTMLDFMLPQMVYIDS